MSCVELMIGMMPGTIGIVDAERARLVDEAEVGVAR